MLSLRLGHTPGCVSELSRAFGARPRTMAQGKPDFTISLGGTGNHGPRVERQPVSRGVRLVVGIQLRFRFRFSCTSFLLIFASSF